LALLQVPPVAVDDKVIFAPGQTLPAPVIVPAVGNGSTVITYMATADPHPVAVYFIVSVPAATPVTTPVLLIVAILGKVLLQVPPAVLSVRVMLAATQTVVGPLIGPTLPDAFTDMFSVADVLPQELVTV
jgi:hypothetical protein